MTSCRHIFTALLLTIGTITPLFAQQNRQDLGPAKKYYEEKSKFTFDFKSPKAGGAVKWTAAKQEFVREDYVLLEGDVKIYYQDVVMSADRITYNLKTRDVDAQGHVIIDEGPRRISGDHVVFNLATKIGTFFHATAAFEPSIYFIGDKIEKIDQSTYRLTDGMFTSCDLDNPSWSFELKSGLITLNDYARLRDISFRAKRVPLLYLPYMVWPTKSDRSRGFLVPKIGASNQFGAYLGNAYFVPFGVSADATIQADAYSKGFFGLGTRIRYVPTKKVDGKLDAYTVRDADHNKLEWKYAYTHTEDGLPGGFRGVIDIQDYSNLEFFKRFERNFNLNTLSNIYSAAYLTKNSPSYSLNIRTDRRKLVGFSTEQVYDQLPAVQFTTYPNRVGSTPLYFAMESSLSHLRRTEGPGYGRGDIFPTLSLQMRTPAWFSVKPQISARETYYTASRDPLSSQVLTDSISRKYAQAQVEFVGPSFSRIFDREAGGFQRFKHVIEPRLRYLYTTDVENQNRVLQFDTVDSPYLPIVRNSIEYSLTNRIIGKGKGENASAREILSFSLRQTAAIADSFSTATVNGHTTSQKFSPLTANLHFNPYSAVSLDASTSFSNVSHQLQQTSTSANVSMKQAYLNFTWFSTYRQPGQTSGDSSQVRIITGAPIWKDRVRGDIHIAYDAKTGELLEQRYITGFQASCYSIAFEYRDFVGLHTALGPVNSSRFHTRDYQVSVSLKNVGTFVDLRGSFGNK